MKTKKIELLLSIEIPEYADPHYTATVLITKVNKDYPNLEIKALSSVEPHLSMRIVPA